MNREQSVDEIPEVCSDNQAATDGFNNYTGELDWVTDLGAIKLNSSMRRKRRSVVSSLHMTGNAAASLVDY